MKVGFSCTKWKAVATTTDSIFGEGYTCWHRYISHTPYSFRFSLRLWRLVATIHICGW